MRNCMCCHTEKEYADQPCYLTQSQYTDASQASPSADPTKTRHVAGQPQARVPVLKSVFFFSCIPRYISVTLLLLLLHPQIYLSHSSSSSPASPDIFKSLFFFFSCIPRYISVSILLLLHSQIYFSHSSSSPAFPDIFQSLLFFSCIPRYI